MTEIINEEQVIEALREVVKETGPEHIDPNATLRGNCVYVDDEGNSSCIAGRAFEKLGHKMEKDIESSVIGIFCRVSLAENRAFPYGEDREILPFGLTINALNILAAAQSVQDNGEEYGKALENAEYIYSTSVSLTA